MDILLMINYYTNSKHIGKNYKKIINWHMKVVETKEGHNRLPMINILLEN